MFQYDIEVHHVHAHLVDKPLVSSRHALTTVILGTAQGKGEEIGLQSEPSVDVLKRRVMLLSRQMSATRCRFFTAARTS